MTLKDTATFIPGQGHFYLAPADTARPDIEDLLTGAPASPWVEIGHTSLEDIFSFTSEGGEATMVGTLQNSQLRQTLSPRTTTWALTLQQFDADSLKLFFGSNAVLDEGWVEVQDRAVATTKAFLAVFADGDNILPIYASKAEISQGEDLAFGDTESLAGLPLSVTPLVASGSTSPFSIGEVGYVPIP